MGGFVLSTVGLGVFVSEDVGVAGICVTVGVLVGVPEGSSVCVGVFDGVAALVSTGVKVAVCGMTGAHAARNIPMPRQHNHLMKTLVMLP